jgi:hypothetical protein
MITSTRPAPLGCSYNRQELRKIKATNMDIGAQRNGRNSGTQLDAWLNSGTKEDAWNALADARFEKTNDPSNEVGSVCDNILIELEHLMDG